MRLFFGSTGLTRLIESIKQDSLIQKHQKQIYRFFSTPIKAGDENGNPNYRKALLQPPFLQTPTTIFFFVVIVIVVSSILSATFESRTSMDGTALNFHHYNNPHLHRFKNSNLYTSTSPNITPPEPASLSISMSSSPPPSPSSSLSSSGFRYLTELLTNEKKTLGLAKAVHAQALKSSENCDSDSIARTLISIYFQLSDFRSACTVFFVGFSRNYVLWSSFIEELESYGGKKLEVLEVFSELHNKGVIFDSRILTVILKICSSVMDSWLGLEIHSSLIKKGFDLDVYINGALMNFYGRCLGIEYADKVFHEMSEPKRDDHLWNEAIMVNLRNNQPEKAIDLFRELQFSSVKPSASAGTIVKLLQACGKMGNLGEGKQIHGYVLKHQLDSNLSISNSLIIMYFRNGKLELARKVFDTMKTHNLSSWNSMISGYTALGYLDEAWNLFHRMDVKPDIVTWNSLLSGTVHYGMHSTVSILKRMQSEGFRPNSSSVASVLQAVTESGLLNFGKQIHGYVIRNGLDYDVYVGTSLIDMYVKNDCLSNGRTVFDNMDNRNVVAWNSLISGYSFRGLFDDAERLLRRMEDDGVKPDLVTWNGLLLGYTIQGHTAEAFAVIRRMKTFGLIPNVVSWTTLISGSSRNGRFRESLRIFSEMQRDGVKPNSATISSLLRACGGLCLLQKGKEIHCISIKNSSDNYDDDDVYVGTALIDMYSKSGNVENAKTVFNEILNKTIACWNCLIMGFAIHGFGEDAFALYDEMCDAGIHPDGITFTALLSACKNSGFANQGWKYFDSMSSDYGITPTIEHYSCMVDLLGKSGYLDEAWDFIQTMPLKPDATIWGALLGNCRIHNNIELAEVAAKELFELEPYNSANYVMMMNLYSMSNRTDEVEHVRDLMKKLKVKTSPVWSWIQVDQTVNVFSTQGKTHPDEGLIYFELYQIVSEMKKLGYKPDVDCVLLNIDKREKEKVVLSHTEKLAITYGLMKIKGSTPIRVIKNTRVCPDCHTAAKYISLIRNREIFLRDGVRFHHFKEGKCCCNDCW